jgi:YggT family protein
MFILCQAILAYSIILFVRIILSWVSMAWSPPPSLTPVIRVIYDLTEPVLGLVRRYIPPMGGLDLSPLIIFLAISLVRRQIGC